MRQPEKVSDKGLILYFHGNAGNLARWGAIYSDFESFGYDMFIMDYRGFGKSRGKKSNRLLHGDAFMVYEKMSRYYEGKTIIIYGRSIGSGFACELAARANPKFLFLETPFSSISDLFYTYYPFLPRWFVFHYRFDNKKKVEQVAGPVYVFHGTRDWIIPLRCAELLKVHLKPKDRFTVIPGAGHHNLSDFPDFVEARRRIFTT
jgi:pimeloyl-ACP methyl ester carboxylesterase